MTIQREFQGLPLPPIQAETLLDPTTPVDYDGSFLNLAPIEQVTGLPLRVAPLEDLGSVPKSSTNPHHGVFPGTRPEAATLSGKGLRESCIQTVLRVQHNFGPRALHNTWSGTQGPPVSQNPYERLGQSVILRAGYIPNELIDTSGKAATTRAGTAEEHAQLRTPRIIEPVSRDRIESHAAKWGITEAAAQRNLEEEDSFFASTYRDFEFGIPRLREIFSLGIKRRILEGVAPDQFKAFVTEGDSDAGLELIWLGANALSQKAVFGGESLEAAYESLLVRGELHPLAPNSAAELMVSALGSRARRLRWLPKWREDLLSMKATGGKEDEA